MTTILGIETSCDDTAASIIRDGVVLSNVIASQDIHDAWGGIVPELASREHVKAIGVIVREAMHRANTTMDEVDAIAVTNGPGLPGSLHVGTQFAKGLALRFAKPIYPIHHIEAHVYSGYLEHAELGYPTITLVVSGGHTSLFLVNSPTEYHVLGSTRDDAAGEAFDKIAKMLGLGYPGGPHIDKLAKQGNASAIDFPRGLMHEDGFDFSFSGLKTAVKRYLHQHPDANVNDVCASAQQAIVDVLVHKTLKAVDTIPENFVGVCIAGGVSANTLLREKMSNVCTKAGITFIAPRMDYCVDNAAMIGFLAQLRIENNVASSENFSIDPRAIRS